MQTKRCAICLNNLPLSDFDSKTKGIVLVVADTCRQCIRTDRKPLKLMLVETMRRNHKRIPPELKRFEKEWKATHGK